VSRSRFEGLESDRRSRSFYLDGVEDERLQAYVRKRRTPRGSYIHMFLEDAAHVFPWRRVGKGFEVNLANGAEGEQELFADSLPTQYGHHGSLEDSIRQFAEATVPELLLGPVYLEVAFFRRYPDQAPEAFRVLPIVQNTVFHRRGRTLQIVPGRDVDTQIRRARA
jgi:hypothetical protein